MYSIRKIKGSELKMYQLEQLCLNKINNCEILTESELEHLVRSHEIE